LLGAAPQFALSCLLGVTSLELGLGSEGATRTVSIEGTSAQTFLDVSVSPRVRLVADERRLQLAVDYAPSLLWLDATSGEGPDVTHTAHLTGSWSLDPRWRLGGSANATYGITNFLASPVTSPTGNQTPGVPTLASLRYGHGDAAVNLAGDLGRGLGTRASLEYSIDGGVDGPSQTTLPVLRSIRFLAGLDWHATGTAVVANSLDVVGTELGTGRRAATALLTVTWRQRSGPQDEWWLGAGGSTYYEDGGGRPSILGAFPAGEAGYQHTTLIATQPGEGERTGPEQARAEQRVVERIALRALPYFDRLTGDVYERVEAAGSAGWTLGERWRLEMGLIAGVIPRSNEAPASLASVETHAGWRPGKLEIRWGVRALWQRDVRVSAQAIREMRAFLGVAFADIERL
jgi:hypothetical protein